ncbi:hypothetical protein M0R45_018358 [Rubus argutus]|uniref:DUF4283 domain-containing protein n=1 Tax=Rubus argutus TaxID=59490 RepID=A0AAW1X390_RUBAR
MSWFILFALTGWNFLSSCFLWMEEVVGEFTRKLALADSGVVEVTLRESTTGTQPDRFFLVGELLTSKKYRLESLISTLRGLWVPKSDSFNRSRLTVCCLEGSKRLLFSFKFQADLKWVVKGCPWTFEKSLFAVAVTNGIEDPLGVSLSTQFFWARIRGFVVMVIGVGGEVFYDGGHGLIWGRFGCRRCGLLVRLCTGMMEKGEGHGVARL